MPSMKANARTIAQTHLHRIAWRLRAREVELKLRTLAAAVTTAKFDPNQPRVPAGNPGGGQWAVGGASAGDGMTLIGSRISPELEEECWVQYEPDLFQCRMVGVPVCYDQAMLRYSNCFVGRPIPPLNY